MLEGTIMCHSCGREMEHMVGKLPCEELTGWFMVSYWKGRESIEHYSFCSADCLRDWLRDQSTKVPDAFLKSFDE
jgi:hypothetical protein